MPVLSPSESWFEGLGTGRAVAWNAGVLLVVIVAAVGSGGGEAGAWLARTGWALMLAAALALGAIIVLPVRSNRRPADGSRKRRDLRP